MNKIKSVLYEKTKGKNLTKIFDEETLVKLISKGIEDLKEEVLMENVDKERILKSLKKLIHQEILLADKLDIDIYDIISDSLEELEKVNGEWNNE